MIRKTISIARIAALVALALVGFLCLFSEPEENLSDGQWMWTLLWTKALAAASIYGAVQLYKRWSKTDKWIKAYEKYCEEADAEL